MVAILLWYVVSLLIGWAAFPLAYRLFPALVDRGYTFSRSLGLLAWCFIFYLFASLGVLQNDIGGILAALLFFLLAVVWAGTNAKFSTIWNWVKAEKWTVIWAEIIFVLAFAAMALARSANPDISGTEKPMEMAFINAILHSPAFPPHDPWLSGYAISYYYFGYVMVAMLIQVTGVTASFGFNLAIALWFGLGALGAYGVVFNLFGHFLRGRAADQTGQERSFSLYTLPVLGPVFLLIVSNFEGLLELLRACRVGWTALPNGSLVSPFFSWLQIQELDAAPTGAVCKIERPTGVLWWRASRVIQDFDLARGSKEIIDEFPFFSFLLGDLHPHVLAMPFVLLVIGMALNLFFEERPREMTIRGWRIPLAVDRWIVSAAALGGLAFLNTWDFPIYLVLFTGVLAYGRFRRLGEWRARLLEFIFLTLGLGASGIALYLPFYTGLQSQAGGVIPSLIYFTRGVNFWVMFGPLLIPILLFLLILAARRADSSRLVRGLQAAGVVIAVLWGASFLLSFAATKIHQVSVIYLYSQGAQVGYDGILMSEAFLRRLASPGTWVTCGLLLSLVAAVLVKGKPQAVVDKSDSEDDTQTADAAETDTAPETIPDLDQKSILPAHQFALGLVLLGVLLALGPEFFYLRDQFGTRMNTIFKLYYQVWILWSLAAAYAALVLAVELRGVRRAAWQAGLVILLAVSFIYPVFSLQDKLSGLRPGGRLTLDGIASMAQYNPDDLAAIQWLAQAAPGVVSEAVGGSYTGYARVSTFSGLPTVLGWPGHVSQWRGGATEIGSREGDIQTLYASSDWQETANILERYHIRYIFIGSLERSTYNVKENKFERMLKPVFQNGQTVIYEYVPAQ